MCEPSRRLVGTVNLFDKRSSEGGWIDTQSSYDDIPTHEARSRAAMAWPLRRELLLRGALETARRIYGFVKPKGDARDWQFATALFSRVGVQLVAGAYPAEQSQR